MTVTKKTVAQNVQSGDNSHCYSIGYQDLEQTQQKKSTGQVSFFSLRTNGLVFKNGTFPGKGVCLQGAVHLRASPGSIYKVITL